MIYPLPLRVVVSGVVFGNFGVSVLARLTKQVGYRVGVWTLDRFREICAEGGLRPSQAVERFMELAVEKGSVKELLDAAERGWADQAARNEVKARVLLAWLEKGKYWYGGESDEEFSVKGQLYDMLGRIWNKELLERIEAALKKAD